MLKRPIREEVEYLDSYYRDCVIGGAGAFVLPVTEPGQLVTGIKTKLILEIAGLTTHAVEKAQAEVRIDCVTGKLEVLGLMRNQPPPSLRNYRDKTFAFLGAQKGRSADALSPRSKASYAYCALHNACINV